MYICSSDSPKLGFRCTQVVYYIVFCLYKFQLYLNRIDAVLFSSSVPVGGPSPQVLHVCSIVSYSGQVYQALKQTEKALSSYKTCYQLDTTQKDVLETIGQLLLELPIDPGRKNICT